MGRFTSIQPSEYDSWVQWFWAWIIFVSCNVPPLRCTSVFRVTVFPLIFDLLTTLPPPMLVSMLLWICLHLTSVRFNLVNQHFYNILSPLSATNAYEILISSLISNPLLGPRHVLKLWIQFFIISWNISCSCSPLTHNSAHGAYHMVLRKRCVRSDLGCHPSRTSCRMGQCTSSADPQQPQQPKASIFWPIEAHRECSLWLRCLQTLRLYYCYAKIHHILPCYGTFPKS
jgi:hypothetical protein